MSPCETCWADMVGGGGASLGDTSLPQTTRSLIRAHRQILVRGGERVYVSSTALMRGRPLTWRSTRHPPWLSPPTHVTMALLLC